MHELVVHLPLPPSLNNIYGTGPGGKRYLVKRGRDYKHNAIHTIQEQALSTGWVTPPGARLALDLTLFFENQRRTDISNRVKIIEDALAEALGFDDTQVDDLRVRRIPGRHTPASIIRVTIITEITYDK